MNSEANSDSAGALESVDEPLSQGGDVQDTSRRISPRVEAKDSGAVTVRNVSYTVEICNVSRHGAQIQVRQGLVPVVGQMVHLQFVNGTSLESRVMWVRDTLVGLRFDEPLPDVLDGVYFDDLGSDYFRAVLKLQIMRT